MPVRPRATAPRSSPSTSRSSGSAVLLSWGGHLAQSRYWNLAAGGVRDGAGEVSGAPWHMRTLQLDGSGNKNQDRSIQPSAIVGELGPRALAPAAPAPAPAATPRADARHRARPPRHRGRPLRLPERGPGAARRRRPRFRRLRRHRSTGSTPAATDDGHRACSSLLIVCCSSVAARIGSLPGRWRLSRPAADLTFPYDGRPDRPPSASWRDRCARSSPTARSSPPTARPSPTSSSTARRSRRSDLTSPAPG